MDLAATIAGLTFLVVVTVITVLWALSSTNRRIRGRLDRSKSVALQAGADILRSDLGTAYQQWGRLVRPLVTLVEQAGYNAGRYEGFIGLMGAFAIVGGGAAWFRTGVFMWGAFLAPVAGSVPVFYLLHRRQRRFQSFEGQFPDALDMLTRAIRAGYALSAAIQVVGDEMPDPAGQEFRRVSEEIQLGMDHGEALSRLRSRVSTEDMGFFCTAINIHRSAGGNLAEILDRLSEVIRERFKLLSHARVLSAQHRWSAICVGLSPLAFVIIFGLTFPRYFESFWASPLAPYLIGAGIILEAIGFVIIWRIAKIKV